MKPLSGGYRCACTVVLVLLAVLASGHGISVMGQSPSGLVGKSFTVKWFDFNGDYGKLRFHFTTGQFIYEALPQGYQAYGNAVINPQQGNVIRFTATTFRSGGAMDTHVAGVVVVRTGKPWLLFARGQVYSENGKATLPFYIRGKQD